ncbi:hypothetical protein [Campylobacter sp. RM16191]|uniref:hypothetical protein n=1 Tax=Campylobacter sp. RM16191 TaxID=1705728 RepID=UPI001474A9FE|nr:hypothetical protein [Campylobacter sp. RM16191]
MSNPDREKEREMFKRIDSFNLKQKKHAEKVEWIIREVSKFDDMRLNRIIHQIELIKDD